MTLIARHIMNIKINLVKLIKLDKHAHIKPIKTYICYYCNRTMRVNGITRAKALS